MFIACWSVSVSSAVSSDQKCPAAAPSAMETSALPSSAPADHNTSNSHSMSTDLTSVVAVCGSTRYRFGFNSVAEPYDPPPQPSGAALKLPPNTASPLEPSIRPSRAGSPEPAAGPTHSARESGAGTPQDAAAEVRPACPLPLGGVQSPGGDPHQYFAVGDPRASSRSSRSSCLTRMRFSCLRSSMASWYLRSSSYLQWHK